MPSRDWHIITGEYPPQPGGVSDYTHLVAAELAAAGEAVQVWCPPVAGASPVTPGVVVQRELGALALADLRRVGRQLDRLLAPRRLLVQWVPHGYRYRAMNLGFCWWLWQRAARYGDQVELMVHEPYLPFGGSWRQTAAALVQRLMTMVILRSTRRVWMSIPAWERRLRPYALGRRIAYEWLPVAGNVPQEFDPCAVAELREWLITPGVLLIGHYGTFGRAITDLLRPILTALLRRNANVALLLVGPGGEKLRDELSAADATFAARIHATGRLETLVECTHHLKACDLLVQPFPDGMSSRRTSAMAGLALGLPMVTTMGELSETLWAESGAVVLAAAGDTDEFVKAVERLMNDADERRRLGCAAGAIYQSRFAISHTVAGLRG